MSYAKEETVGRHRSTKWVDTDPRTLSYAKEETVSHRLGMQWIYERNILTFGVGLYRKYADSFFL